MPLLASKQCRGAGRDRSPQRRLRIALMPRAAPEYERWDLGVAKEKSQMVNIGRTQAKHNESAYPLIADIGADISELPRSADFVAKVC